MIFFVRVFFVSVLAGVLSIVVGIFFGGILVLLRHKTLRCWRDIGRAQHGHRASVRTSSVSNRRRIVAIELEM
jgi:5-bromo-4-chloroindolyl phosphate hydrolysis protein